MPIPSTPTISLTVLTSTSLQVTIVGTLGVTYRVYVRQIGTTTDTLAGSRSGSGTVDATGLLESASYLVFVVALDSGGDGVSLPAFDSVSLRSSTTVAQAMQEKFASSFTLSTALSGNLWTGEVPEETPLPYAWLETPYAGSTYTFECEYIPATAVIHILAIGALSAENLAILAKDVFDDSELTFTDKESVWCVPRSYRLIPEMVRSKSGTLLFRAVLTYDLFLERDR